MEKTKKNSLLIIDDDKSNILELKHILGQDYNIHVAKDGQDAIEIANEYLPDVILLDIIMPEMDGYEVITVLKRSEKTKSIPVIFVTGLNDAVDEEKGLIMGAADYISKPYRSAIVKLRVRNQIQILNYIHVIERLSALDQLTEMPNRRSFDERLSIEWNRSIRDKTSICLLFIDIDNFKFYNDTYGHQHGDAALKILAQVLMHEFKRSVDFVARIGGEEFVVVLSNTDNDKALAIAERLRNKIEGVQIPIADGRISTITVSIGISTLVPSPENSVENFIKRADEALYCAKREGRNRVYNTGCYIHKDG